MIGEESIFDRLISNTREKALPFSIVWELTYRCNLRCRHCYLLGQREDELPISKIKEVADELAKAGTLFLTLTGGEPLIRSDFFEIANYLKKRHFAITIFTNGTLIDQKLADKIAALTPWSVEISIYGAKAETHDRITTVPGSFKKSLTGAKLLKERGVHTVLKTLWMKENINEVQGILDLVAKLDTGFRGSVIISQRNNGDKSPLYLRLSDEELFSLFKITKPSKEEPFCQKEPSPAPDEEYISTTHPCGAGTNSARISPSGFVYPCAQFLTKAGDLKESSFADIWASAPIFKKLRAIHFSDLIECRSCPYFLQCLRCPALAELENGSFLFPHQEACRIAKIVSKIDNEEKRSIENEQKTLSKA
jgi:radical SAM protein with 4Fe4S-binding SPASM domain